LVISREKTTPAEQQAAAELEQLPQLYAEPHPSYFLVGEQ